MFRSRFTGSVVLLVLLSLTWRVGATAAATVSASGDNHSITATLNPAENPAQHAIAADNGEMACADAWLSMSTLADTAAVAGMSIGASLKTIGFIYGLAAVIAFLVALLIKFMAMTLHRL